MKADFSAPPFFRCGQFADRGDDGFDLPVVRADFSLQFVNLGRERLVLEEGLAKLDERPDHMDAHLVGGGAIENVGRLNGTVFGEGKRKVFDVLALLQGRILRP